VSTDRNIEDRNLPTQPLTVLVIEDEVLVRMVIADYLRECGFRVVEASTADEGMRVLKTNERVDIVFSDVQMPGSLDGFELAQWLRARAAGRESHSDLGRTASGLSGGRAMRGRAANNETLHAAAGGAPNPRASCSIAEPQ
jgi:CheY-like chemotaxis protein